MIQAIANTSQSNPKVLQKLENKLKQKIEEAKFELLRLRQSKQYTNQIVQEIDTQNEVIQKNNYLLEEIKFCFQLEPGSWVKKISQKDKKTGQVIDIKIQGDQPIAEIQWLQESTTKLESLKDIQILNAQELDYYWEGSKFPKFIRNLDGLECEDRKLLQSQLAELEQYKKMGTKIGQSNTILDNYDQQIVYCKERLAFLNKQGIENAELKEKETLIATNSNHSTNKIETPKIFSERKIESTTIAISQIIRDPKTQQREELDLEVVEDYCEAIIYGIKLPPVKVTSDGFYYWLYDGFHTLKAAEKAGLNEIEVQITPGNLRKAILKSVGVNAEHGLPRSRETKRRAAMTLLKDPEWREWSDCEIAKRCKVSQPFVSKLRKSLTNNVMSDNLKNYKDKHGNLSKMNTLNIGNSDSKKGKTNKILHSLDSQLNHNQKKIHHNQKSILKTNNIHPEQSESKKNFPEFETNQLVELNFCTFDGVSEELKLLNHRYGIITSKVEVGNGYRVKFFEHKHKENHFHVISSEDLRPLKHATLTLTFEPKEYISLMNIYGNRGKLYEAIKQLLIEVKAK